MNKYSSWILWDVADSLRKVWLLVRPLLLLFVRNFWCICWTDSTWLLGIFTINKTLRVVEINLNCAQQNDQYLNRIVSHSIEWKQVRESLRVCGGWWWVNGSKTEYEKQIDVSFPIPFTHDWITLITKWSRWSAISKIAWIKMQGANTNSTTKCLN